MWCWRRMLRIHWTAKRMNTSILTQLRIKNKLSTVCCRILRSYCSSTVQKSGQTNGRRQDRGEKTTRTITWSMVEPSCPARGWRQCKMEKYHKRGNRHISRTRPSVMKWTKREREYKKKTGNAFVPINHLVNGFYSILFDIPHIFFPQFLGSCICIWTQF